LELTVFFSVAPTAVTEMIDGALANNFASVAEKTELHSFSFAAFSSIRDISQN